MSITVELGKLCNMASQGLLDKDEFATAKKILLGQRGGAATSAMELERYKKIYGEIIALWCVSVLMPGSWNAEQDKATRDAWAANAAYTDNTTFIMCPEYENMGFEGFGTFNGVDGACAFFKATGDFDWVLAGLIPGTGATDYAFVSKEESERSHGGKPCLQVTFNGDSTFKHKVTGKAGIWANRLIHRMTLAEDGSIDTCWIYSDQAYNMVSAMPNGKIACPATISKEAGIWLAMLTVWGEANAAGGKQEQYEEGFRKYCDEDVKFYIGKQYVDQAKGTLLEPYVGEHKNIEGFAKWAVCSNATFDYKLNMDNMTFAWKPAGVEGPAGFEAVYNGDSPITGKASGKTAVWKRFVNRLVFNNESGKVSEWHHYSAWDHAIFEAAGVDFKINGNA